MLSSAPLLAPVLAASFSSRQQGPCAEYAAALTAARDVFCSSGFCPNPSNVSAKHDWPSQVTYMHTVLTSLTSDSSCFNTSAAARDTLAWLEATQTLAAGSFGFISTWTVFQVQYYDMPRKPGVRIEAPDTLGRKCWAFAYLDEICSVAPIAARAPLFAAQWRAAVPQTLELCERVMANCFVNESYDPSRNGTCPNDIFKFHRLGFARENALRGFVASYEFYPSAAAPAGSTSLPVTTSSPPPPPLPLPPPKVLIVVAHPDDDCGFGGLVYRLAHNLGAQVDLAVITDGAGGYRYSAVADFLYGVDLTNESVARDGSLRAIRQREEREGARYLGIRSNISFLGEYDAFTTNATEALSWWRVERVRAELRALLDRTTYDFVLTMLPGEGEEHGEHKAATILALEVATAHASAPVVLGGPDLVSYTPLADYPITRAPAAPAFALNRSRSFGFRGSLDYRMVVAWAMAAHKSQGGEAMELPSQRPLAALEHYWLFDANPAGAAERASELFTRVESAPFRYFDS